MLQWGLTGYTLKTNSLIAIVQLDKYISFIRNGKKNENTRIQSLNYSIFPFLRSLTVRLLCIQSALNVRSECAHRSQFQFSSEQLCQSPKD